MSFIHGNYHELKHFIIYKYVTYKGMYFIFFYDICTCIYVLRTCSQFPVQRHLSIISVIASYSFGTRSIRNLVTVVKHLQLDQLNCFKKFCYSYRDFNLFVFQLEELEEQWSREHHLVTHGNVEVLILHRSVRYILNIKYQICIIKSLNFNKR